MLKPQEVSSAVFEKAVFGGYEIGSVDQFLSEITEDYSTLYRENELLKNRLSALTEKIEEYRANEDAMRLALLSAKRSEREMAEKLKAAPEASEADASEAWKAVRAELEEEQEALRQAKEATAAYLARFREATAACDAALTALSGAQPPEAEEAAPDFSDLNFGRS